MANNIPGWRPSGMLMTDTVGPTGMCPFELVLSFSALFLLFFLRTCNHTASKTTPRVTRAAATMIPASWAAKKKRDS